jgi:hypothetical protein
MAEGKFVSYLRVSTARQFPNRGRNREQSRGSAVIDMRSYNTARHSERGCSAPLRIENFEETLCRLTTFDLEQSIGMTEYFDISLAHGDANGFYIVYRSRATQLRCRSD